MTRFLRTKKNTSAKINITLWNTKKTSTIELVIFCLKDDGVTVKIDIIISLYYQSGFMTGDPQAEREEIFLCNY